MTTGSWLDTYMNRTNAATRPRSLTARRRYDSAMVSLGFAEDLRDLLKAHPLPDNPYFADALDRAEQLVDEMSADLDDVMDTYTPEECGA